MRKKSEENFLPGSQFVRIGVPLITERKFRRLAIQSSVRTGQKYLTVPCEGSVRSKFFTGRKFVCCSRVNVD